MALDKLAYPVVLSSQPQPAEYVRPNGSGLVKIEKFTQVIRGHARRIDNAESDVSTARIVHKA